MDRSCRNWGGGVEVLEASVGSSWSVLPTSRVFRNGRGLIRSMCQLISAVFPHRVR